MISLEHEFIKKTSRLLIAGLCFLCFLTIGGVETRETHQMAMFLVIAMIFGLFLKNVWITLFLWWTIFLFSMFKFRTGAVYVNNVIFGCILYYLTKVSFKKEHISFFINMILWVLALNLSYLIFQAMGWDFLFKIKEGGYARSFEYITNTRLLGFMGNIGVMAMFTAMCVPLLATRGTKLGWVGAMALFYPLWRLESSTALLAAVISLIFILFFKVPRKVWIIGVILLTLMGGLFIIYDKPLADKTRGHMWNLVLKDSMIHPITGWGLDSFRSFTEQKKHVYVLGGSDQDGTGIHSGFWDNPHNLYISLLFEWGIIGLLLLIGYLRQCALWFKNSIKDPNTLALSGLLLTVLLMSVGHFPMFLARLTTIIIPVAALYEIQTC